MPRSELRRDRRQRGATLVEFALTWTLFMIVTLVGVMDFGRAIWAYNLVSHSARVGARYAMVRGSKSTMPATAADIEAVARKQSFFLDQSNLSVTTQWLPDNDPGSDVEIRVVYNFTPLLGVFQPGTFQVGSKSKKVITF